MTTNTNVALAEYANPLNWEADKNGIRRIWREPGSYTPDAYDGFKLASAALSTAVQPAGEYPPLPWGSDFEAWLEASGESDVIDALRAYVDADRAMRAAPPAGLAAVDLPEPDTHFFDDARKSVWSYSRELVRWVIASERAMRYVAPKSAPTDDQVLAITTAYEQGVGKGHEARRTGHELTNPYADQFGVRAWALGYEEGKKQAAHSTVSAMGLAWEVMEKHRQHNGEPPMGMLGHRAMEALESAIKLDSESAETPHFEHAATSTHAIENVALLADILNRRPAMNAGLADAYARWTAEVYDLMGAMAAEPANDAAAPKAAPAAAAPEYSQMPEMWHVDAHVLGEKILSIGNDWLSGKGELTEAEEQAVIGMAQTLLSFVGYGMPPSSFDPDADDDDGQAQRDQEVGRQWRLNSSLEKWFPLTAEKLERLQAAFAARVDASEREAFEAQFPAPGGVNWNGSKYVVEDDCLNSYSCDRFVGQWAAWQARAARGQAPAPTTQAAPAAAAGPDRQTLIDVIAQGLSGTWHCLRVWNAWSFGTMSQDDFVPVDESDTPAELADAVLALLSTAPAPRSMRAAKEGAKHG